MSKSMLLGAVGRQAIAIATLSLLPLSSAWAQGATASGDDVSGVGKIGKLHDNIRRAQLRESLYQEVSGLYADYTKWKTGVQNATNVSFSMDVSALQQWGLSGGGSPALQFIAAPSIDWTVFSSKQWGTGSVQIYYAAVPKYPTSQNAADIQSNLGLITSINDYDSRSMNFSQLTYTQATPDNKWLLTVGQYPMFNFDGNAYLGNQQQNFNNYILAQNGTATYPLTGWGAYLQFNATGDIQFAAGLQATNNVLGQTLTTSGIGDNCCAWFGYVQWTPSIRGLGSSQYSLSYFDTPALPGQPSSRNWSINAVQNLNSTWAVFARANGASGYVTPIRQSYALGGAMNNPLNRSATDQIGLAVGYSDVAPPPTNPSNARNEKIVSAYWTWTLFGGLLLTPSAQVIFDPGLNPDKDSVTVLSLRATFMF